MTASEERDQHQIDNARLANDFLANGFVERLACIRSTREEIDVKYPRANAPGQVYGNERRTVTIAVGMSGTALAADQLAEAHDALGEVMPQLMPGLEWLTREIVTINGRRWIHFAMVTPAVDTKIRNEMYMTSFRGKMLLVNLNATIGEYDAYKGALEEVRSSLRVSLDTAAGPDSGPGSRIRAADM